MPRFPIPTGPIRDPRRRFAIQALYNGARQLIKETPVSQLPLVYVTAPERVVRLANPRYGSTLKDALSFNPVGSRLNSNRYSGKVRDYNYKESGSDYHDELISETAPSAIYLSTKSSFGAFVEMRHYTKSKQELAVERFGDQALVQNPQSRIMGQVNPVLGMGGNIIIEYTISKPLTLFSLNLRDPTVVAFIRELETRDKVIGEVVRAMGYANLVEAFRETHDHLPFQILSSAIYHSQSVVETHGVFNYSFRGDEQSGTDQGNVIALHGEAGTVTDRLDVHALHGFDFSGVPYKLPRIFSSPLKNSTYSKAFHDVWYFPKLMGKDEPRQLMLPAP